MRIWFRGELRDGEAPMLPGGHPGLLAGDGLFETLRSVEGRPHALDRHLDRLQAGATMLHLRCPARDEVKEAFDALLTESAEGDLRMRLTMARRKAWEGELESVVDWWVTATRLKSWPLSEKVVTLPTVVFADDVLRVCKTVSYAGFLRGKREATERGAGEGIWFNHRAELCEGTASSVFLVREGELWTPPLSSGCLPGVTRSIVMELAEQAGIPLREEPVARATWDAGEFEELFLTSSTRGVHPVHEVDDRRLETPGPVTQVLLDAYARQLAAAG